MLSYKSQSTQNELMNSCIDGIDNLFQTIYNIESHDDFTFMVDDLEIKCNRLFASFISPTITKNFQTDRTINSFTFHVEDFIKIIKSFNNVILQAPLGSNSMLDQQYAFSNEIKSKIQEKLIEIIQKTTQLKLGYYVSTQNPEETSINEYLILLKIFKNLGNDNFVQKLNDNFNHYLTKHDELPIDNDEEIAERIQIKEKIGISKLKEIEYIKNHFCELNTDILNEIDQNIIETAITSKNFQVPDEDSFLYQILEMNKKHRSHFLPFVQFPYLSVKAINIFLKNVDFHDVNRNLWNSVALRLIYPITELKITKRYSEPMKFVYKNNNAFDGIFNFLNKKCGGNAHLKGLVEITSSGEKKNHCYDLIDNNFDSFFCTNNGNNTYIQFDFKDLKISISKYAMKTLGVPVAKFISWAIYGSNDQIEWKMLVNRYTNAWPGYNNISIDSIDDQGFYRYIKIKMTGYNAAGSFDLNLSGIEFFGSVKQCKRNRFNKS